MLGGRRTAFSLSQTLFQRRLKRCIGSFRSFVKLLGWLRGLEECRQAQLRMALRMKEGCVQKSGTTEPSFLVVSDSVMAGSQGGGTGHSVRKGERNWSQGRLGLETRNEN